jgi:ribosomal protein S18 acetylase RimI-like enzyme
VDPAAQGRGIGAALIGHAARHLADAGRAHIGLVVTRENPARERYARMGFEVRGERWILTVD